MVLGSQFFANSVYVKQLVINYFVNQRQNITKKTVLSNITFTLEEDDKHRVDFKGEKPTFILILTKN